MSGDTMAPPADATTPRHPLRWLAVAAGCVAVIVGGWALSTAGALDRNPGWTADSGPVIAWGLPLARLLAQSCAVLTIGFLLGCLLFAPTGPDGALSAVARRHAGLAGATAGGWAVASFCQLWFTAADLTGVGAAGVRISAFTDIAQYTLQGRALLIAIVAATAVQLCLRVARRPPAALVALLVAVGGTLPFAFTGHAATSGDHNTATTSLALHILASSLWVGGLVALLGHARWDPTGLPRAARRFSGLALLCFLAVAGTGALNAWLRMGSFEALVTSDYGLLVQLKALALVALAAAGWWHRERTLPALTSPLPGERRLFPRFAATEIVVMAASLALATALGRSIPPRVPGTGGHSISEMLLGYAMPAPPTVERLLFDWRPDLFFATGCLVAVVCYLLGVKRLRQTPPGWPLRRTLCWLAGVLLLVAATSSGLARYGPVLFSVHLGQHLLVAVAAPILLVLGAPATLARRALPPVSRDARYPGAREWLNAARRSRAARLLIRPPVATTLWIAGAYVPYVTGGYEYALRNHPAHLAMYTFFIASGCLFFGSLLRSDASSSRSARPARWAGLLAALVGHAVLGIVVIRTSDPFAAAWFAELQRPWQADPLTDQITRGTVVWAAGQAMALLVGIGLLLRSIRARRAPVVGRTEHPDTTAPQRSVVAAHAG